MRLPNFYRPKGETLISIRTCIGLCAISALVTSVVPAVQAAESSTVTIREAWARATPPGIRVGGGYVTVVNSGTQPDRLIGASSPLSDKTEIHTSETTGGMARMRWLEKGLEIPAGKEVVLAPGGVHLMFMGLKRPIVKDEVVPVTLRFERAGEIAVELRAGPIGSLKAPSATNGATGATHAH